MKDISRVHFRIIDNGIFIPIARRLARDAGRVTYWTASEPSYPSIRDYIGEGFEDIERVEWVTQDKNSVDCWVFPHIGMAALQEELLADGRLVWGARRADTLEISRGHFLAELLEEGLPVPKYEKIEGATNLRLYLKDKEDLWIKVSRFRRDWETFHWRSFKEDFSALDARLVRFGVLVEKINFYVFENIDTTIEDGADMPYIDGEHPKLIIHGMEQKDEGYLCTFQKFDDLPETLRTVHECFGRMLGEYGARCMGSSEVKIVSETEYYFLDATVRFGSPPHECMTEMVGNLAELIYHGANGELVEPEPAAKFAVQAAVQIAGDEDAERVLEVDDELDRWLKAGCCLRDGNRLIFPPGSRGPGNDKDAGFIVGIGDKLEEAIFHLRHNVSLLPDGAMAHFHVMADLIKEVQQAEAEGMPMTKDQIPEPEIVLQDE